MGVITVCTNTYVIFIHVYLKCLMFLQSIHHILPYIHKLVVKATRSDLVTLLKVGNPLFSSLSNEAAQSYERLSK